MVALTVPNRFVLAQYIIIGGDLYTEPRLLELILMNHIRGSFLRHIFHYGF
jgi:hypothetical protein